MRQPRPIALTVGGTVDPEDVIGREHEVGRIFDAFDSTSVVLTGERRMGKTSLARVIERDATRGDWSVIWQSGEGFLDVGQFTEALINRIEATDSRIARVGRTIRERWGFTAGPITVEPSRGARLLDEVVAGAVEASGGRLLLVLDELPILARTLEDQQPGAGTAVLHGLRRLRQDHGSSLRMLCLGSVGFHHVVRGGSGVINDLSQTRLGPLSLDDATFLARCLLLGAEVTTADDDAVAAAMARAVEGVPYYVHHLVATARRRPGAGKLGPDDVEALVDAAVTDADDPWDLRHYRDRVGPYYGDDAPVARAALDAVAAADGEGLTLPELQQRVNATPHGPLDSERIRDVVERLEADHYLVREGDRRRFAFSLVRRAWLHNRT